MKAARREQENARLAAVLLGEVKLLDAWPDYFRPPEEQSFPAVGADMTEFEWEEATPESYQSDLDALLAASEHISVPEEPDPVSGPALPPPGDLEWT